MSGVDSEIAFATTGTRKCLFGENRQIKEICDVVRKVARSNGPVLIRGESGTGKEILAAAIHSQGPRSEKPFLAVNSGAIPPELFESELFGHLKGSFTGADRDKKGRFDEASGGSLFLDEIGDMPLFQQVKLLRVLQTGEVQAVGEGRAHKVDVRVITATNKNLEEMVRNGTFREDLYFRLNLFVISIPALRERPEDILPLANIFMKRIAESQGMGKSPRMSGEAEKVVKDYSWPGNVRELENAVHYGITMCDGDIIRLNDLPDSVRSGRSPFHEGASLKTLEYSGNHFRPAVDGASKAPVPDAGDPFAIDRGNPGAILPLETMEKTYVLRVYGVLKGNKTKTARALGISLRSLQMKLKSWGAG